MLLFAVNATLHCETA